MQIPINKSTDIKSIQKHLFLAGAFLLALVLASKVEVDLGGLVSFTFQTLVLSVGYYLLPKKWRLFLILSYMALGIARFRVFNGDTGWAYVISWPLGFFIGFVLAAFIPVPKEVTVLALFSYLVQIHVVILTFGICVVGWHAGSIYKAIDTLFELLPGLVIKSLLGTGLIWVWNRYYQSKILHYKKGAYK